MQKQIDLKVKTTGTPATAAAASTKNNLKESEDDINAPRGLRDNPFEKLAKGGRYKYIINLCLIFIKKARLGYN